MSDTPELLTCPFCGEALVLTKSDMWVHAEQSLGDCILSKMGIPADDATQIAAWNTRDTQWRDIADAPYETKVITLWQGDGRSVYMFNTKNSGTMLGKRDEWWYSKPSQMPQKWMPLPPTPEVVA